MFKNIDLDWSAEKLFQILQNDEEPWIIEPGINNKYCRTNNEYIVKHLYQQIMDLGFTPKGCYFAEMLPFTELDIHKDYGRHSAINFPIVGDWANSPLIIYNKDKSKRVFEHFYENNQAILFNTQNFHTVLNNSKLTRYILSISIITEGNIYYDDDGQIVEVSDKYIRELEEFHKSDRNN